MSAPSIACEGLGKQYLIRPEGSPDSPAGSRSGFFRRPSPHPLWAVRGVSFAVQPGENVAILGRNGSGKSTLLKMLARVCVPTEGRAEIRGRVGALLEVGTGFQPDLTGRENVYLSAAFLGMPPRLVRARFDAILAFSEIEEFIDVPVKRYSSGMRVRLGFAVAAELDVDVLLLDEVLAVGDAAFRQKCHLRLRQMLTQGRTVVSVSHDTSRALDIASRALWLDHGKLVEDGPFDEVLQSYIDRTGAEGAIEALPASADGSLRILAVSTLDLTGSPAEEFAPLSPITIEVRYFAALPVPRPYLRVIVSSPFGPLQSASNFMDGARPEVLQGEGAFRCTFHDPMLLPGRTYTVRLGMVREDGVTPFFPRTDVARFVVKGEPSDVGFGADTARLHTPSEPCMLSEYSWSLPDGTSYRANPRDPVSRAGTDIPR